MKNEPNGKKKTDKDTLFYILWAATTVIAAIMFLWLLLFEFPAAWFTGSGFLFK